MKVRETKKDPKVFWSGHMRYLGMVGTGITGLNIHCRQMTGSEIAYTTEKKEVYLNTTHPILPKELPLARTCIDGLFFHEIGHQLYSNFQAQKDFHDILRTGSLIPFNRWMEDTGLSETLDRTYKENEITIFHSIWNMIEDPSIEYWIMKNIGGDFEKSLRYMIGRAYKYSQAIEEGKTPFGEIERALIQYGDVGLLKGKFKSNETRKAFFDILPIVDEAIYEPNAKRRIALSYKVFKILEPFWKIDVENQESFEELMNLVKDMLEDLEKNSGKGLKSSNASEGSEESESDESDGDSTGDSKSIVIRRKKMAKALKNEIEKSKEGSEKSNESNEADEDTSSDDSTKGASNLDEKSDENEAENESNSVGDESGSEKSDKKSESLDSGNEPDDDPSNSVSDSSNSESSDNEASSDSTDDPTSDSTDESSSDSSKNSSNSSSDEKSSNKEEQNERNEIAEENDVDLTKEYEDIWEEARISDEDIDRINSEIDETISKELAIEKKNSGDQSENLPDFGNIVGRGFTRARCKNLIEIGSSDLSESYELVVSKFRHEILILTERLKRATQKMNMKKVKRSSGKINLPRYSKLDYCQTVRIFDRKKEPDNNDIAVFVNVDESGSMWGDRIEQAKFACIVIAEACARAGIPLYIMGFTADIGGYDAYHLHYIRWKNSKAERWSLMNISARDNNFDGYSLRYASKMLKQRNEERKLLIVISDGQPAANAYRSYSTVGISDTFEAVRQATSDGITVHGIAIGGRDDEVLKKIYGINFTQNEDLKLLIKDFGNSILKQLR